MFSFEYDAAQGILIVRVEGMWTLPEVARYGREAGPQFEAARIRAGSLRLLVELSRTEVLSQNILAPLAKAGMQFAREDDRVALVVASSLMKLQMRRMIGEAPANIFVSEQAARMWLTAHDQAAVAE